MNAHTRTNTRITFQDIPQWWPAFRHQGLQR